MSGHTRSKLTYANVVSTLCLFLLLGGGAFAASKLAKNSVGSKQIKTNAVGSSEIGAGQVTGAELADGAVTGSKLADGSVSNSKLVDGAIDGPKLADGSVVTSKLADGSVATSKLADGAVTAPKLGIGETRVTFAHAPATIIGGGASPDTSVISTGALPAGDYAVFATVNWEALATSSGAQQLTEATCTLSPSSGPGSDTHLLALSNLIDAGQTSAIAGRFSTGLMFTTTIPQGAMFQLSCHWDGGANISLHNRKIVPIRLKSQTQEGVNAVNSG